MQEFFSHCIAAILHTENFANIALLILSNTLLGHHNDSNKMKGKNKVDQNPPFGPLKFFS